MINQAYSANTTTSPAQATYTVLLATDKSGRHDLVLENAIQLARHKAGRLVITYFADPNDLELFDGAPADDIEWRAHGRLVLTELAKKARAAGVLDVQTILEDYQGEERLSDLAQRVQANIILLASHNFSGGLG
jgi:nucleotide-binding universal stress UspA family protein